MPNPFLENIQRTLAQETLAERGERMWPAAIYGALVAVTYTLSLALVNVYTFPNLPLGLDWTRTLALSIGYGLAFALMGVVAGWFTNEYGGIAGGGAVITALLGLAFLFQLGANNSALTLQSVLMALPLFGVSMLAAGFLRWAARRHVEILHAEPAQQRPRRLAGHITIVLLIGLVPGILSRMDLLSEQTLSQFHQLLQTAPQDTSVLPRLPLKQVPALQEHLGVSYTFYARPSEAAVGSLDVTVRFQDGFTMTCFLPIGGSSFITDCVEGETFSQK
jgi:hypothetical protein